MVFLVLFCCFAGVAGALGLCCAGMMLGEKGGPRGGFAY